MDQKDNFRQILKLIQLLKEKNIESGDKRVAIFNEIIKCLKQLVDSQEKQQIQQLATSDGIIDQARNYLNDPKPQVRSNVIKFLRYLIDDRNIINTFKQKGIQYFIARSLQRDYRVKSSDPKQQVQQAILQEILQALKLIHRWLEIQGAKFPKILGNALVALAENCDEQLKRYAIMTLRVFALNATDICGWCGGIRILIESATNPSLSDISDQIVWSLLYLLNEPGARQTIRLYLDLSKWFSIFTEIDPPVDTGRNEQRLNNQFEANLQLAKKAIISVLKSWQGLIYLGDERQALKSLIQVLRQPIKPAIRNSIYDILKSLLSLGNKENVGVSVANRSNQQDTFIGEYKINNLLNNYLVMLVQVLLDCDLFKILVELSGLQDVQVSKPAQVFLKDLSSLMFNLIPDCNKYTDFLISAANQNDPYLVDLKSWSSEIVNTMGNYAFDTTNRKPKHQISKFLYQCESLYLTTQLGLPTHKLNNETVGIIRGQIEQDADENKFQNLIKQSNVPTQREDYNRWNWTHILELLETFLNDQTRFHEAIRNRFLKSLLYYYLPSNMQFVKMEWKPDFIQAKCGYLLLKLLLKDRRGREIMMQPGEGYFIINKSYVSDLFCLLKADVALINPKNENEPQRDSQPRQGHPAQNLLNPEIYHQKMIREYISWIGLFSCTKHGQQMLEQTGIFQLLDAYIQKNGSRDHILIHLIHSLNYGKQNYTREFFQNCLRKGSVTLTKSCLDFIRLLYRSELHDFSSWAIDLLIHALNIDDDIGLKTLSVVEEVTQDPENMNKFLEKINLGRLKSLCKLAQNTFMITILSHKKGFDKIFKEMPDYLLDEIENWKNFECAKYIEKVEKVMCLALEFVQCEEQQLLFKFPLLLNNSENPYAALSLIYKMPWNMYLTFEGNIEAVVVLIVSIDYPGNSNQFTLIGKPQAHIQDQLIITQNSQFQLKLQVAVGKIMIDHHCKEVTDPYLIRCDYNDKKTKGLIQDGILSIDKNGVQFCFEILPNNQLKFVCVKVNVRMGENKNNTIKMPAHMFGELSFTDQGFSLLKNYIDHFQFLLKNPESTQLQKRSALWTIGHIGQSKNGVKLIRDLQLIPELVKMAEQDPVLSLRGTCLYALNLICTTNIGRKELEQHQWISHLNCNSGWLCIPKNIYQFFYIRISLKQSHNSYWPFQDEVWDKYQSVLKSLKLNEEQKKVVDTIALMSNFLTQKDAEKDINNMKNQEINNQKNQDNIKNQELASLKRISTDYFTDIDVFHHVLLLITFYQFTAQAKNKIFTYFDKMFNPQSIQAIVNHPIYQQLGLQDGIIL